MTASIKSIVDKAYEDKSFKDIIKASPAALQGVTDKDAELLQQAFNIKTIEDFATSKFVLWAQALTTLAKYEK